MQSAPPLAPFHAVCDAIALLLQPHAEVVLHDLATETVAHIANPFSRREVGEPSLLHEIDFRPDVGLIGPYDKLNFDGRRVKSVSAVLRGWDGVAIGVLCINLDVTQLQAAIDLLGALTRVPQTEQPAVLFKEDWHERINQYVHAWTNRQGIAIGDLSRDQKRQLVLELAGDGAFGGKHAAAYISRVLQMSRASVYNYLRAAKTARPRED
ncbi:helix-turn-helix transcriptional regulator [Tabrizicola sp. BL-A-41-H6]|uniref:helix-turn-helix transcriptional regulator n=1 Tax=Tabrizicola sp. BL-A-41-H6 TaxID=3421107 RepID=UPI003D67A2FD